VISKARGKGAIIFSGLCRVMNERLFNPKEVNIVSQKVFSMKTEKYGVLMTVVILGIAAVASSAKNAEANNAELKLVAANSQLSGLPAGAVFPFLDSTPNRIVRAHIAVTDSTTNCSAGGSSPANIKVLAGNAGAVPPKLVAVNLENLGIGSDSQCVFHMTVTAGEGGIPHDLTDIVVVNGGAAALTSINTATASATVRIEPDDDMHHMH
jgi:hypothetical protein